MVGFAERIARELTQRGTTTPGRGGCAGRILSL
jgi:hypothetical protein